MATLTSNISNVSLTVSGNTQQSTTISWTLPTVPSGATISSCTLTGKATASMSKGNATITVNGQTVSSGSNFTINLGTANTTSSVTATAKGGNKNASGTVTFSNLVYTVNYSINYTVTFVDYDGTVLKTQSVASGSSATAPSNPTRTGYRFTGWDKAFTNVNEDLTVTAQYVQIITYTVTFLDYDGNVLKTQTVESGNAATAPASPNRAGYKFTGWDNDFSNITSNLTVTAQYVIWYALNIKDSGSWVDIGKVFRKVNGVWVEENNEEWVNLFNTNTSYKRKEPHPTAILYEDGALIFSPDYIVDESHGNIVETYTGWDADVYTSESSTPWYSNRSLIKKVYFNNISAKSTSYWLSSTAVESVERSGLHDITNMRYMFYNCKKITSLDLSSFDTSNVTSMYSMFYSCSLLTSLDLSSFDTSNVTSISNMFHGCSSLTSLDLSSFDTSNVTNMSYMFYSCSLLTSLDISSFDMANVTNIGNMFSNCSNLKTIYVKDETAKTKIESSTGFPSTATVIIGKPA